MKTKDMLVKLIDDQYYILASSTYADDRTMVVNNGDCFGIFDRHGDVIQIGDGIQGIYYKDTRYLNELEMYLGDTKPVLLSSDTRDENHLFKADLTNPDMDDEAGQFLQKSSIHISRSKFLVKGVCYERITLRNYSRKTCELELKFNYLADFKDIFEIRGMKRDKKGKLRSPDATDSKVKIVYEGLDNITRTTEIIFSPAPDKLKEKSAKYKLKLGPKEDFQIDCHIVCHRDDEDKEVLTFDEAHDRLEETLRKDQEKLAEIYTSNEQFNDWINRSKHDLLSLLTKTEDGEYPYAGVPWFNTAFGRDGIITAMESLWLSPQIAKGVLEYLAKTQATEEDPERDAEPGKIMHETRECEMAITEEVPFGLYYGTVDATPLYVVLAGQYFERTNDKETIKELWPSIQRAIEWIDKYGDVDGDGFTDYKNKSETGLTNQGWKDSGDSVMHEDGELAEAPIALCEVQGYVYAAKKHAAIIAEEFDEKELAEKLDKEAKELKQKFNEAFWDEELGTYVLALDGNKQPCKVKTSNAGHCLFTGIADKEKAERVVKTLMSKELFSGWGIRTLASDEARYNPISYHNGSVWPHDTAIVACGMASYEYMQESLEVLKGMFEASLFVEDHRLPELFCGFEFKRGHAPTDYPVACSPQAWAISAVFLLLQSCLQMTIKAKEKQVIFNKPVLPEFLSFVEIKNLKLGDDTLELEIFRYEHDLGFHIMKKPEDWEVVVKK